MSLAVPNQLNYQEGVLPVAIESRSNKRIFEPVNGTTFAPDSNNVIRFNINSDNLWDMSHSYLQVKLTNLTTNNTASRARVALDTGIPWCNRMQIMSGGQELENIDSYNRLHAMLMSVQGNPEQAGELALTTKQNFPLVDASTDAAAHVVATADAAHTTRAESQTVVDAVLANCNTRMDTLAENSVNKHSHPKNSSQRLTTNAGTAGNGLVEATSTFTYNINLISAILNTSKYFPLIFSNLGLDVLLYLEPAVNIGVYSDSDTPTSTPHYEISNCKWHCHLVDVDRTFYDKLRSSMMSSGGVLTFSGTTYKHYLEQDDNGTSHSLSIPTRVKSLNSLWIRPQRADLNNKQKFYCLSVGEGCNMTEYLFRIGSMQYPQQSIKVNANNKGELYSEIRKCVGVLGNYAHSSWINDITLNLGPTTSDNDLTDYANTKSDVPLATQDGSSGTYRSFFVAPYGFEGFAKTAAESTKIFPAPVEEAKPLLVAAAA